MTERRSRKPRRRPACAPAFSAPLLEHVASMTRKGLAPDTVRDSERCIAEFSLWCLDLGVEAPRDVTLLHLERYARHLFQDRTASGASLSLSSQHRRLSVLRVFFRFLARKNFILTSPATELALPDLGHRLPRTVLTHEEAERVLAQPDVDTPLGIRDRSVLETLYSTGVRRTEIAQLSIFDIDVPRGTLLVREGKGKRDRVVPIGERALDWLERYRADVRPRLGAGAGEQTLYLNHDGEPLGADELGRNVTAYVDAADLGKRGSCHLFRHTMATLMLEKGADLRIIQEILGHSSLNTTQLYTQVAIDRLKDVHARTHPASRTVIAEGTATPATSDGGDA